MRPRRGSVTLATALPSAVPAFVLSCAVAAPHVSCAADPREITTFRGPTMGTRYMVRVVSAPLSEKEKRRIRDVLAAELARATSLFSAWDPDSEISRFNRHTSTAPFPLSAETLFVLEIARRVSVLSDGVFDVTVAPLVEAWGFGPGGRPGEAPSPGLLGALRERVGFHLLRLDPARGQAVKARADATCDLSAIVPGWAADRIASALADRGYPDVLVDVGGEVVARGRRPDGEHWRVAVESPPGDGPGPVLEMVDAAVATSGDYRRFWMDGRGRRRSHILDPRTGEPVTHGLASVTVVHPQGIWADALATALFVLGPEDGASLARREGLAARFVLRRADGTFSARANPAFRALVRE